jgi:phenylacetate-CoA ligase
MKLGTSARIWARDWIRIQLRQGRAFRADLHELLGLERLSPEELLRHQATRLEDQITRAARHVPYYRRWFETTGLQPADCATPHSLTRLPLLDKSIVKAQPGDFRDQDLKLVFRGYTSGTTGSPLVVYRDLTGIVREHAMIWRQRHWLGVEPGDPIAVLRGELVTPVERTRPPFWRLDRSANELVLSSHHLASAHLPAYLDILRAFSPVALYTYPSSARELARLVIQSGQAMVPLRAVFTASETLTAADRELIGRAFGAPVVDRYGNAERTLAGGHCERGGYHLWSDVTLPELVPGPDGEPFELVGTPLYGRAMPLFRYRTGDRAYPALAPGCPCGRAFPTVACIAGREDPVLLTRDGRPIGRLDHIWKGIRHVAAGQILQEADLTVRLRLVPEPGFSPSDRAELLAQTQERLGKDLPIVIEELAQLPRTAAGKFQAVVSLVPEADRSRAQRTYGVEADTSTSRP